MDLQTDSIPTAAGLMQWAITMRVASTKDTRSIATRKDRLSAYRDFNRAVWDMTVAQQLARSMVPRFKGAVWTVPAHSHRLQRVDETVTELLLTLAEIRLVGMAKTGQLAEQVAIQLGRLAAIQTPQKESQLEQARTQMDGVLSDLGQSMKIFIAEARRDLGHDKARRHWWQVWRSKETHSPSDTESA